MGPLKPFLTGCLLAGALAVPALAAGDASLGKAKSDDERCQECHGRDGHASDIEDGIGNIGKFPKLAGQHPEYIAKQVRDFRSGKRNHEVMAMMARGVDDGDLADIAAYFASQKPMQGEGARAGSAGAKLFAQGDPARNILACASCHGEGGRGLAAVGAPVPAIGGQHRRYLHKQLTEWKAGERTNSNGGIMTRIAAALSEGEIDALSDYISGL